MKTLIIIPALGLLLGACTMTNLDTQKNNQLNTSLVSTISSGSVSLETKEILQMAYSEEILAEDIYSRAVSKYPEMSHIQNVVQSEEKHSVQVGKLLDARGIARPIGYRSYSGTYDTLVKMVDSSLTGAIEAGVMIEVGDIDHLLTEYQKIKDPDIRMVFENIGGASYNHLRAFLRLASQNNYTVTTDYARYMISDEINSSGPLQSKMTELLKANNLPTSGNSKGIRNGQGNRQR